MQEAWEQLELQTGRNLELQMEKLLELLEEQQSGLQKAW